MALDPSMRASDSDRELVIARLRDGHAEGRLTMEEFESRLDATYAARTLAELVPITRDLPATSAEAEPAVRAPARREALRAMWGPWVVAVSVCTAVWLAIFVTSGEAQAFWPVWVAGPWGAVLLARTFLGGGSATIDAPQRPGRQPGERDHR